MPENPAIIKVTVLFEHYKGESMWTASIPLIPGCWAEGVTPENAQDEIMPEIEAFLKNKPNLINVLKSQPEFLITQVDIPDSSNQTSTPSEYIQ